jgi:plasmid stabilization system protein ParE
MTGFVLSPRAQADLEEIWDYTAATWDTEQAKIYVRLLQEAIGTIAENPCRVGHATRSAPAIAGIRPAPMFSSIAS